MYRLNDINRYRETDRYTLSYLEKPFYELEKILRVGEVDRELGEGSILHLDEPFVSVQEPNIETRIQLTETLLTMLWLLTLRVRQRTQDFATLRNNYRQVIQELGISLQEVGGSIDNDKYLRAVATEVVFYLLILKDLHSQGGLTGDDVWVTEAHIPFTSTKIRELFDELPRVRQNGVIDEQSVRNALMEVGEILKEYLYKDVFYLNARILYVEDGVRRVFWSNPVLEYMMQVKYQDKNDEIFLLFNFDDKMKKLEYTTQTGQNYIFDLWQNFNSMVKPDGQNITRTPLSFMIKLVNFSQLMLNDIDNTVVTGKSLQERIKNDYFTLYPNIFEVIRACVVARFYSNTGQQGEGDIQQSDLDQTYQNTTVREYIINEIQQRPRLKLLFMGLYGTSWEQKVVSEYLLGRSKGGLRELSGSIRWVNDANTDVLNTSFWELPTNNNPQTPITENPLTQTLKLYETGQDVQEQILSGYIFNKKSIIERLIQTIAKRGFVIDLGGVDGRVLFAPTATPSFIYQILPSILTNNNSEIVKTITVAPQNQQDEIVKLFDYGYERIEPKKYDYNTDKEVTSFKDIEVYVKEEAKIISKNKAEVVDEVIDKTVTLTDVNAVCEFDGAVVVEDFSGNIYRLTGTDAKNILENVNVIRLLQFDTTTTIYGEDPENRHNIGYTTVVRMGALGFDEEGERGDGNEDIE